MGDFLITVRLAEPFREGVGENYEVREPVANLGQLIELLKRQLPAFEQRYDHSFNFAVNGFLVLHKQAEVSLKSGDEVELMMALAGG